MNDRSRVLQPAILAVDPLANLFNTVALLYHFGRIQRLVLTVVNSRGAVAVREA